MIPGCEPVTGFSEEGRGSELAESRSQISTIRNS